MSHYRPIPERIKDFNPVEIRPDISQLKDELKRCQDCGVPFCHSFGCPLGNVIPEINAEAAAGRYAQALYRLLSTSPFPEFTARICPALCQGSCVQGLSEDPVPFRLAELEVIERGFALGLITPRPPKERLDLSVGVIGSGPAGLSAAFFLNRAGANVSVYEKDEKPGGFMRYGIPDFKLEKSVIDRRLDLMSQEGVTFYCGLEAGADISQRLLFRRHKALVLAIGSRNKRDLPIPGRELKGIHFATDYLSAQNRLVSGEIDSLPPELNAKGLKVTVIGGGDTGSDCVGTAWRQGAAEVTQFEIMPKPPETRAYDNPWPQWPRILRTSSSHEEGGLRRWNITSNEFLPQTGHPEALGAIRCQEVEWETKDGRLVRPIPKAGTEFLQPTDMVFLAMGFTGPEPGELSKALESKPDSEGRLSPGLYACGDAASGPSLVVRAIADGLRVARTLLNDYAIASQAYKKAS
jgi:glutamate synthase (NADPH/NADH) small chain